MSLSLVSKLTEAQMQEVNTATEKVEPCCVYCESKVGHDEIVYTGDHETLFGYELWFCCHICRDNDMPCETFFSLG